MQKVRIGVVGAGWWATENHIPVLQSFPGVEVAGVCSLGSEQLRAVQDRFGIPFATENYEELLALSGLDGVVISTPHDLHFQQASAALERGLHVVCEKPMVLHAWQARKLVALTQSHKLHFLVPFGWNYSEDALAAKRFVDAGEIGTIEYVHCHMASALRDLFSGTGAWFAENAVVKPAMKTWNSAKAGGGFAHGQLSHALGLLLYITGLEAAEVFALIGVSPTGADLYNSISCRFRNGATGTLGGAATMPPRSTYQLDIRLFGSEGMLLLDIERPRLEVRRDDGRNLSTELHAAPGAYDCIEPLRAFVGLVRGEKIENRSGVELGAHVVELIESIFQSARSGTLIAL